MSRNPIKHLYNLESSGGRYFVFSFAVLYCKRVCVCVCLFVVVYKWFTNICNMKDKSFVEWETNL